MRAHHNTTKVQPLSLHDLLQMREQVKTRLERESGVTDAAWLQEVYQRCNDAIVHARIEQNVSGLRAGVS